MKSKLLLIFFIIFSTFIQAQTEVKKLPRSLRRKIDKKISFSIAWDDLLAMDIVPDSTRRLRENHFSDKSKAKVVTNVILEGCDLGHTSYVEIKQILKKHDKYQRFNLGNILSEGPAQLSDPNLIITQNEEIINLSSSHFLQERYLFYSSASKAKKVFDALLEAQEFCMANIPYHPEGNRMAFQSKKDLHPALPESHKLGTHEIQYSTKEKPLYGTLVNSADSFRMRFELLKDAKERVYVQSLNFHGDEAGMALAEALIEVRRRGVHVDVPTDAVSNIVNLLEGIRSWRNYPRVLNNMMAAGINVLGNDCNSIKFVFRQIHKALQTKRVDILIQRPHEKYFLVDNKGLIGGTNTTNSYFGVNPPGKHNWEDHDVYIEGEDIVGDLWKTAYATVSFFDKNYPAKNEACMNPYEPGTEEYEDFYQSHRKEYLTSSKPERIYAQEQVDELIAKGLGGMEQFPLQRQSREMLQARIIQSRPKLKETHIQDALLEIINNAKEEIVIINAYFIPPIEIRKALFNAMDRGVKVTILTNSKETNDLDFIVGLGSYYYKDILDYGHYDPNLIQMNLWTGKSSVEPGTEQEFGLLHSKMLVVDRSIAFVSSYNFDYSSISSNSEIGILFESPELANDVRNSILHECMHFSRPLTYTQALYDRKARGLRRIIRNPHLFLLKKLEYKL